MTTLDESLEDAPLAAVGQAPLAVPPTRLPAFLASRIGGLPRAFWLLWTGSLVNRLGTMVEPFLGLYLTTARGLSLGQAGAVMAVLGAGSLAGQFLGGTLADRVGRRRTLLLSTLGTGVAMLALGYARGLVPLIAAAGLLGVLMDMYRPASQAMVADLVPGADRARAFGLNFWAVNLGWAVAMASAGALAHTGFTTLFWIDAATAAAFGTLVWRAVPETRPKRPADGTADGGPRGGFLDVLRDRVMVGFTLTVGLYVFVLMQVMTTMPMAMREHGLGAGTYGWVIALNGVVIITVQPLVNTWLARRDHALVLATGMAVVAVGIGFTALATRPWQYAAAVVVWSLGEIVGAAVLQAIVAGLAPEHLRGRYSGLYGLAWSGGFMLAPLGGTQLLGLGGSALMWPVCGALGLVAAGVQLALGPAIRRRTAVERS
ncbi:MDR family MFS transporter [Actinomadura rupiterrae]|uniref:MDR family MFS transporter n=1 Tax=Actinomadura rupiterrae TaxID=559627 RepID=UPI0020A3D6F0|nr:MFS transporter [Actinomadura rupiterrae]MCP2338556.1 MFS family permease [Actinomadura rupiterrae]